MNNPLTIAFDVDGTLIGLQNDSPRYEIIQVFLTLHNLGHNMVIWSGGGVDYAERWAFKLGLDWQTQILAKGSIVPDIAFDDEDVQLGKVNVKV